VGHAGPMQWVAPGHGEAGRRWNSALWPLKVLLFFRLLSNACKFKNLYKFDLKLEKYETNLVG
jgi:hypothetical protein